MSSLLQERIARTTKKVVTSDTAGPTPKTVQVNEGDLTERIRQNLYSRITRDLLTDKSEEAKKRLRSIIVSVIRAEIPSCPRQREAQMVQEFLEDLFGYGAITKLMEDPSITEIMVNRFDQIYYEKDGKIYKAEDLRFRDNEHVFTVMQKIVGPLGRRIDESSPMVDARLPDGSRVNAVIPPLAIDGPCLTIRKFGKRMTPEDYIERGSLDRNCLDFLSKCVQAKVNILITGGTGTGKTTFLNMLSSFIPEDERIVTIEDSAELYLQQPHVVRLESRPPNVEGKGAVTIRDLVRNSLRMRPDRIIVGEARGAEALDLIQAMNTGHEGSLATIHANSPQDAINRLAVMIMMADEKLPLNAIREQIGSSLDLIVHIARMRDGSRKVVEIAEVGRAENGEVPVNSLLVLQPEDTEAGKVIGKWVPTGYIPTKLVQKFSWRNMKFDERWFRAEGV